jgi:hypothetical protein
MKALTASETITIWKCAPKALIPNLMLPTLNGRPSRRQEGPLVDKFGLWKPVAMLI